MNGILGARALKIREGYSEFGALQDHRGFEARTAAMKRNLGRFVDLVDRGRLIDTALTLTSKKDHTRRVIEETLRDARFNNWMADLLHGSHTSFRSVSAHIFDITIIIDSYLRVTIPENQKLIKAALDSVTAAQNAVNDAKKPSPSSFGTFIQPPTFNSETPIMHFGNLQIEVGFVIGDEKRFVAEKPAILSGDGRSFEIDGDVYYNGMPPDRANFPTVALAEGSHLAIRLKNIAKKTEAGICVIPTMNGMPLLAQSINLSLSGFETSDFPLMSVDPRAVYLRAGEEKIISAASTETGFRLCTRSDWISSISDTSFEASVYLPILLRSLVESLLPQAEQIRLGEIKDADAREYLIHLTASSFVKELLSALSKSRETDVIIKRPVITGKASDKLDNPFLGSLGFNLMNVTQPPVKASHEFNMGSMDMLRGGEVTRSMGGSIGLATVGGGFDRITGCSAYSQDLSDWPHEYVGMAHVNLGSTTRLRVV